MIWWEEFGDTVFAACSGKMFFNRIVAPKFLGREGDLAAAALAESEELPELLAYLESAIPASGFLVGDRLTLADLAGRVAADEPASLRRVHRSGGASEDRGMERGDPVAGEHGAVDREGRADDGTGPRLMAGRRRP